MVIRYGCKDEPLDVASKVGTELALLAKDVNVEIIHQWIAPNRPFVLNPSGLEHLYEFIYVLSGKFKQTSEERIFNSGDYILVKNLQKKKYFKALTEVELLYITNGGVFKTQKNKITELNELLHSKEESHLTYLVDIACRLGFELRLDDEQVFRLAFAVAVFALHESSSNAGFMLLDKKQIRTFVDLLGDRDYALVAEIVTQQYERYDGNGYPYGLSGDEILIESQVLSIVIAYDQMVSGYQDETMPPDEVCKQLLLEKTRRYHPQVVDTFIKLEKKFRKKR